MLMALSKDASTITDFDSKVYCWKYCCDGAFDAVVAHV